MDAECIRCMWVLGTQTQFLTLAQQALYPLSCFLSPSGHGLSVLSSGLLEVPRPGCLR